MERLKFYDVKTKKEFHSDKYQVKMKDGKRYAVAISPSGTESWKIIGK